MTDDERVEKIRKLSDTIESIDKILRRIKRQREAFAHSRDGSVKMFGGLLTKFFSVFTSEFHYVVTPKELDAELLDLVEAFYLDKRRELEHDLIYMK